MPLHEIKNNDGSVSFKWGKAGKKYDNKKDAMKQAIAISYSEKEAGKKPDLPVT